MIYGHLFNRGVRSPADLLAEASSGQTCDIERLCNPPETT